MNEQTGEPLLFIEGKAIPSAEAYYAAFHRKRMAEHQDAFSNKGVEAIRFSIIMLENGPPEGERSIASANKNYLREQGIAEEETRSLNSLQRDFRKHRHYRLNEEGEVFFQGKKIIGYEQYYQAMVGVLSSLPPNPKVDTVKSKVQQIYQPI
jgi:hypothetical protein